MTAMSGNQPDLSRDEDRDPPLNLERETYGYLVLAAGIAAAFVALYYLPESVPYDRFVGYGIALVIATITIYAYQYVVNTWYEQFKD